MTTAPVWVPSAEQVAASAMERFRAAVADDGFDVPDSVALHRWSIGDLGGFWSRAWSWCGLGGDPGEVAFDPGDGSMLGGRWFAEARLNVVDALLRGRGPGRELEAALLWHREDGATRAVSWSELRARVAACAGALRADGVGPGDRVVGWLPNVPEAIVALLATQALGATFSSSSPDFGVDAVVDRFGQVEPTVLLAADGYLYGGRHHDCLERLAAIQAQLPTVRRTVLVEHVTDHVTAPGTVRWDDWLDAATPVDLGALERFGFDHPGLVLFTSGTTGKPKCLVHRAAGVVLKHLVEHQLHCDVRPGDRALYFTTTGWMMWNWLSSVLASGATAVLYEGSPAHPGPEVLFDLAAEDGVSLFGTSAAFLDRLATEGLAPGRTHDLAALRTLCSTGSPLAAERFAYVHRQIKADVHLAVISGGTDLCGCFLAGDPTRPVWPGEMQGPALAMAVEVLDDDGQVLGPGDGRGELTCARPFPTQPLGFWGDADGARYRAAYYDRFPGSWAHGDWASWTEHGGMVIHGRSDTTLNAGGVRIGTAELYGAVEHLPEVAEAVAVAQEVGTGSRIVLFLRLVDGAVLDAGLEARIRAEVRARCSPRHVPARIAAVTEVPRTRSGKLAESAVADVVNGRPLRSVAGLANPGALDQFAARDELT